MPKAVCCLSYNRRRGDLCALRSWSNALRPTTLRLCEPMSYAWGNQTVERATQNLALGRRVLRSLDAIVPRSETQYWVMIFAMLAGAALLLATLLDNSPIF